MMTAPRIANTMPTIQAVEQFPPVLVSVVAVEGKEGVREMRESEGGREGKEEDRKMSKERD